MLDLVSWKGVVYADNYMLSVCLCFCCTRIAAFSPSACLLTRVPVECVNIFTVMFGAIDCVCFLRL